MNELLIKQAKAVLECDNLLSALCNITALLYDELPGLNWLGFYFIQDGELVLGPFQGKVACTKIAVGKGVCGTSFKERKTLLVPDVHKFEGHIACDSASNSELVIPIINNQKCYGVLDIDSPLLNRFKEDDQKLMEEITNLIANKISEYY